MRKWIQLDHLCLYYFVALPRNRRISVDRSVSCLTLAVMLEVINEADRLYFDHRPFIELLEMGLLFLPLLTAPVMLIAEGA